MSTNTNTTMRSPARARAARRGSVFAMPAQKAGRNDPCPCGSGKKYKKCHGVVQSTLAKRA